VGSCIDVIMYIYILTSKTSASALAVLTALEKYLPKCSITLLGPFTLFGLHSTFYLSVVTFTSMTMSCWR
jgi:hypothetical protein